jgi:hypothetical protein
MLYFAASSFFTEITFPNEFGTDNKGAYLPVRAGSLPKGVSSNYETYIPK